MMLQTKQIDYSCTAHHSDFKGQYFVKNGVLYTQKYGTYLQPDMRLTPHATGVH